MSDLTDDVSRWLYERPFQDNPARIETTTLQSVKAWDVWLNQGKKIPDLKHKLIHILEHERDPVDRNAAAQVLGFVGGDSAANALITSLESDVPLVAMEAANSLGRLGRTETIEPLCIATRHADANVRASACTALGGLGGDKALSCLKKAADDENSFVQSAAKEALRRLR